MFVKKEWTLYIKPQVIDFFLKKNSDPRIIKTINECDPESIENHYLDYVCLGDREVYVKNKNEFFKEKAESVLNAKIPHWKIVKNFVGGTLKRIDVFPNHDAALFIFSADYRFSLWTKDIESLLSLGMTQIQLNNDGEVSVYMKLSDTYVGDAVTLEFD